MSNTGTTSGKGAAYPSWLLEGFLLSNQKGLFSRPGCQRGLCCPINRACLAVLFVRGICVVQSTGSAQTSRLLERFVLSNQHGLLSRTGCQKGLCCPINRGCLAVLVVRRVCVFQSTGATQPSWLLEGFVLSNQQGLLSRLGCQRGLCCSINSFVLYVVFCGPWFFGQFIICVSSMCGF